MDLLQHQDGRLVNIGTAVLMIVLMVPLCFAHSYLEINMV